MDYYTTVFRQLLNLLPRSGFDAEARRLGYNRYTKHFTVWRQFLTNLYAQISRKNSLRDIETGLKVQKRSWYRLDLKNVSRSQLSYVNNRRDPQIFKNLYYHLLNRCKDLTPRHKFRFKNPIHIMDSTLINLCLSLFPWAKYKQKKGALKIHTLLDYRGTIPSFVVITPGKDSDIKVARKSDLPLCPDSILVADRAYIDFKWLNKLNSQGIFFVIRLKKNIKYSSLGQHYVNRREKTIYEKHINLEGVDTSKSYPHELRWIEIKLKDQKKNNHAMKEVTLLINNFKLAASTIGQIYQARWEIENFFKWIKQNLRIKTFLGTSQNAVMTQIWTALIYYLLLAYIKYQTNYKHSLLYFARVFQEALFKNITIIDLLNLNPGNIKKAREPDQQRLLFDLHEIY